MKQKAIQDLKNWSEEAINTTELETSGVPIDKDHMMKELKKVVLSAKAAGLNVEEVKDLIWNYDIQAEKYFNEN